MCVGGFTLRWNMGGSKDAFTVPVAILLLVSFVFVPLQTQRVYMPRCERGAWSFLMSGPVLVNLLDMGEPSV